MRRRNLALLLVLVTFLSVPARAQTCLGLTAYTGATPIQVSGRDRSPASQPRSVPGSGTRFPAVCSVVWRSRELRTATLAARPWSSGRPVGYQIPLWNAGAVQLCPVASFGVGLGPRNTAGTGVERSRRAASVGLAIARSFATGPRLRVVPSLGIAYAYQKDQAKNNAGTNLFQIADQYAVAQIGAGLLLDSNISMRPSVEIPFNLQTNEPSIGLTVSYSFGPRR